MKLIKYFLLILPIAFACSKKGPEMIDPVQEQPKEFKFWSTAFQNDSFIPQKYACNGDGISPEMKWENPPSGTKSFVLIMDDPDAPNDTFVHWVVYDVPAAETGLPENLPKKEILPNGTKQGGNGGNMNYYFGPCPPSGEIHRYFFKVYALDTMFNMVVNGSAKDVIERSMKGHILKQAQIMGKYQR